MNQKDRLKELESKWIIEDDNLLKEYDFYFGNHINSEARNRLAEKRLILLMCVTSALFKVLIEETDE